MSGMRHEETAGRTILVVDQRADSMAALQPLLARDGHTVLGARSVGAALAVLEGPGADVLLVGPGMSADGVELLVHAVRDRDAWMPVLLQTDHVRCPPRALLQRLGIQAYHDAADGPDRLLVALDTLLRDHERLERVRAGERLKNELLANVSHEFRTPLNVILGYVELVEDGACGPCPADIRGMLGKVSGSARHLLEMVEEFLDLARLEAGATPLQRAAIPVASFLRELVEPYEVLLREKPVVLAVQLPAELPAVFADPAKLRVVIQNLIANAAKFTAEGRIDVAATVAADRIAIAVRDTGPGIPPEQHEAVFALFHQLQPHGSARRGVGLGLALARRFARIMGGDITLDSAPGAGATFTVTLPVAPPAAAAA